MKTLHIASITTLAASLVLLAGCSTPASNVNTANTNTTVNANVNENTNVVMNENINTEVSDQVDTSDWLTYTNDEYGFSFKYPGEWGDAILQRNTENQYEQGTKDIIIFSNDRSREVGGLLTPVIQIESGDYNFSGPTDGESIRFSELDLNLTVEELSNNLKRNNSTHFFVKKVETNTPLQGIMIDETFIALSGNESNLIHYMFPNFSTKGMFNLRVYGDNELNDSLELLVNSILVLTS